MTGAVSMSTVSMYGGSSANTENSDRKKKSGRGVGLDDGRVGRAVRTERSEERRAREDREDHDPGEDHVPLRGVREERHAVALARAPRTRWR